MIHCAYCERPLVCDACQVPYLPPTSEHYQALSRPEVRIFCARCHSVLVCHWCRTPYDGGNEDFEGELA